MSFNSPAAEIAYWEEQFKTCESLRKQYEQEWYTNLAFYFSKQWVVWQPTTNGNGRLVDPPTPRNRVRLTSNRVKPIVRDELTRLIKEEPQFYVVPNTTDPTDVAAARVGEAIAEYVLKTSMYNRVRRQATFWSLITGTAFEKTSCGGADQDIVLEKVTPFHAYFRDLEEEDIQAQPYVIHGRGLSPDYIEDYLKIKLTEDMSDTGVTLENKFLSALGIRNNEGKASKLVYVKEIWVKPCKYYPQGAMLMIANGKIIYRYSEQGIQIDPTTGIQTPGADSFPYKHGRYPFAKIVHTASGRFYGTSTITDIIPLQKELNKTRSQIIEAKNRMSKPQMTYVKGSIDVSKITSEVGLYIPVAPGFDPPRPIQIEPIPAVYMEVEQRILEDMDEIAGRSQIDRGGVPPGIQAASAIAYLAEKNDIKIYNTVVSIEEATEEVGRQVLALVGEFWSIAKIQKIVSKSNMMESMIFKSSDLQGNTDLRIEAGSMAPKSRAAQQAFITDLMTKGLLPPDKGLRYLQLSELDRLYDELQVDPRQAQRENFRMSQGEQVEINEWDNTPVHLYEHELYMKSQEYEALDPNIQANFVTHHMMTKAKVMSENVRLGNSYPAVPGPQSAGAPTGA